MKTTKIFFALIVLSGLLFLSCSDNTFSPVSPTDQAKVGSSATSLDKKGPIVHSVEGSGLLFWQGKNLGARYTAHEYADGSFDGEYEINCANGTGDPTFKINGNVLSFIVYENVNEFGGKMVVFYGQEKTGLYAGYYDLFFAIDNGQPGKANAPDQVNEWLFEFSSLDREIWGMTIGEWLQQDAAYLMENMGTLDCDKGNITIK